MIYGGHQFCLHSIFTLYSWHKLYGVPSWQEVVCICCHDLGYATMKCKSLDGEDGKLHPEGGAKIADWIINLISPQKNHDCYDFCLYHSRSYANQHGVEFSALCVADKYTSVVQPKWLVLPLMVLSGEIKEFVDNGLTSDNIHFRPLIDYFIRSVPYKDENYNLTISFKWRLYSIWYDCLVSYMKDWTEKNKEKGWFVV